MKGILKKSAKNWFVEYRVEERTPVGHKSWWETLTILQSEFSVSEKQPIIPLENGKEVEFKIVRYCPYHKCSPSEPKGCTIDCAYTEVKYAKLTEKKVKTNGERFDEFMDLVNQPSYPELEGTLEVCKDIINFRSSEISDEEIEEAARMAPDYYMFRDGARWYREQLKNR